MIERETHFHLLHYLVLIVILLLSVVLFFLNTGNAQNQFYIALITSFLYVGWGVLHHHLEGDFHPKIMVEYLLMALLALILLKGAIFR